MVKTWCVGTIDAQFIAQMENVLRLYRLPYDEKYPVISFDERPCFLIGDVIQGLPLKAEQVRKQHYEYEKNGSCAIVKEREQKEIKISWAFDISMARKKMNKHFEVINKKNTKYKGT